MMKRAGKWMKLLVCLWLAGSLVFGFARGSAPAGETAPAAALAAEQDEGRQDGGAMTALLALGVSAVAADTVLAVRKLLGKNC